MTKDPERPELLDPRVQRTRAVLREALTALVLEKGYENVTTREIAERADIGYKTLYRHYANKDDLLRDVVASLAEQLNERLLITPFSPGVLNDNARQLFIFVSEKADLLRVLLDRQVAATVLEPLQPFVDRWLNDMLAEERFAGELPLPLLGRHLLWSSLGLIRWWLQMAEPLPPEKMAAVYVELVTRPVTSLLMAVPSGVAD